MQKKIKVYHFNNGSGGGVLSVIRNLLQYSNNQVFENHIIYTINAEITNSFSIPPVLNISSAQIFNYSPKWNFYYISKKLSQLLPDDKAVIVAHDWLELGMVSQLGLNNPVIQILHGDYEYYYELSQKHNEWINVYVAVTEVIANSLRKKLTGRVNDIYCVPFPVPYTTSKCFSNEKNPLNLIFVGRLTKEKGYDILPQIESVLIQKGIKVKWHIVGAVSEVEKSLWLSKSEIEFYGHLPNEAVIALMQQMDCLVLPSLAEGMPVTVVEAMKVGLTCLVNDLQGGLKKLLIDGVTGYLIKDNTTASYANIIDELNKNRMVLRKIGENARAKANSLFDPIINTNRFEQLIRKCADLKINQRRAGKVYGSRLDRPWIPNFITKTFRSF